jgi:aerotaxis receptor
MKENLPVTGVEQEVGEDQVILSTTDTKGRITYANQEFINISGFPEGELLNKAHNVVRHPDMPAAAFEDLWQTVQSGRSWIGIVKNRCNNGDHYWVNAFVTPIKRNGEIVEYQSVRTRASREDIRRAEQVYQRINQGRAMKLRRLPAAFATVKAMLFGLLGALPPSILYFWPGSVAPAVAIPVVCAAIATMLTGLWFSTRPARQMVGLAHSVVDDPMLQRVFGGANNEYGAVLVAFKMLKAQINALAGRVHDSAGRVAASANDMSNSVALTNQGINHQKTEIENLSRAMQDMLSTAENVSSNAHQASQAASEADDSAQRGATVLHETIEAINTLASQVEQSSEVIRQLAEDTDNISTILDVIKGVAEQTNLLALNAAIEAARAGEQGRGFAVVADEVRSLASRTQDSTQEIENMIHRLQQAAQSAVGAMEGGRDIARNSVEQVTVAGEALSTITSAVNRIKDMNTHIASAAEEQTTVTQEVKTNADNINDVTELTVDTLDSINQTSEEMDRFSHVLEELAAHFKQNMN